jgi:Cysteine-rich CWC
MATAPTASSAPRRLACARCGTAFDCRLGGGCWCTEEPYRLPLPASDAEDCLCPACLKAAAAAQNG